MDMLKSVAWHLKEMCFHFLMVWVMFCFILFDIAIAVMLIARNIRSAGQGQKNKTR